MCLSGNEQQRFINLGIQTGKNYVDYEPHPLSVSRLPEARLFRPPNGLCPFQILSTHVE